MSIVAFNPETLPDTYKTSKIQNISLYLNTDRGKGSNNSAQPYFKTFENGSKKSANQFQQSTTPSMI